MNVSKRGNYFSGVTHLRVPFLLILCIVLLGTSCTNKNRTPSGVLPRDEMEKVLWDMLQADRFSAQFLLKDSATKNVKLETFTLYEKVFQLHKISREEFVKSYKYYLKRPDITKVMFDSLSVRSNRERDIMYRLKDSLSTKPKPQPDTTNKLKDSLSVKPKLQSDRFYQRKDSLLKRKR